MMRSGKILVCVMGGLVLNVTVKAIAPDATGRPYQGIVERNLFNLKAATPPPPPEANKQPPPKILLTGITTILGKKLVTFTAATKPGQPPVNYMMTEGQSQDDIDVLQIDEKANTVRVQNNGVEQVLDFLTNGAKPAPGPAPGSPNAIPLSGPGGPMPVPGAFPDPNANGMRTLPTRNLRIPPPNGGEGAAGMGRTVTPMSMNPRQENSNSAEEQAILIEAQRMKYEGEGNPIAKILPPTEISDSPEGNTPGDAQLPSFDPSIRNRRFHP
jgi:hypothetical protein